MQGPLDDQYAEAIRKCDASGPLMVYVSKMIPAADKGRFFAFGRVFAGTIAAGMKVPPHPRPLNLLPPSMLMCTCRIFAVVDLRDMSLILFVSKGTIRGTGVQVDGCH